MKKFLHCIPRKKYIHIVASLEKVLDLKTTSFEDIIGRLKAYEERVCEDEEENQDNQNKLMYANMEASQAQPYWDYNGDNRNRGRGGRSWNRGRGRGRSYRDYSHIYFSIITCFRCDKDGHFAANCPDRLLKLQEAYETREEKDDTQEA